MSIEEHLRGRVAEDVRFAADALHAVLRGRLPGQNPEDVLDEAEKEQLQTLEYAGELMVADFFSMVRGALTKKG